MDGVTHINCYSKGKTELGRLLTNFARTPFDLDNDGWFASVEAWWYWRESRDESLRPLSGYQAKTRGRELRHIKIDPPTREELKRVYHAKLSSNPKIKEMLLTCELPFDHYYEYGGRRVDTEWRWTGELWNEVRAELKNEVKL